ncbi:threonylcarbamoyl-AMP synthase [bacterium (Candidatus Blackallbacteria) CG17_big_fil_post_rev_8_21_14_2_50_48_46]|uniref:Threonylcarbamoyl-AMP synthase n=1 Tax=bacterium (Candidatus Blackallbacteria) CG17_big_fil_post_rev_8_21_14_2_50_48_46 TaxID=2014261 RepID=A0A2M7G4M1_9BACT|nr:MAG: threonylcarbamoyl-AMP synthase [bacterium (Candidatus Blackallbacteria) CG18_big_fil_WC_8_21_14_2_50_49_26]PIW16484.1 MAG: threonylcarbamoyl-AMP synthase [bacterium (Candidatus Blackallbacteria) CG17_big_fil_post_rev_8_21_14_2_50_48_46]PIW45992.1 MAG: threonylcarbamoyl-AMP synthase [bacterium (Candidatus Blackallbacteria) CG13_big_fil_rev_8_21_14_2_50_49_14]
MQTELLLPEPEVLARAAHLLQQGEVVAMPTETVYGLAGSLWSEAGLMRIFACKERPRFDPLIVHLSPEMAKDSEFLAQLVNFSAMSPLWRREVEQLMQAFWPGPLTLVVPKQPKVSDLATSGLETIALRVPAHPVAQALIQAAKAPLAAPSANRFGRISPTSAQDVAAELSGRIPLILEGGPCAVGLESTVLGWNEAHEPLLLRPGGVSAAELEAVVGRALQLNPPHPAEVLAPGMLKNHYAPRKPLFLLPSGWAPHQPLPQPQTGNPALLLLSGSAQALSAQLGCEVQTLSETGDWAEAARSLFATLRALDAGLADYLLVECPQQTLGLGYAIANRLRKAAGV